MKLKQINKELQKLNKKSPDFYNTVFIRHWNVFFNDYRGKDISIIEKRCSTKLYSNVLNELSDLFKLSHSNINTHYSSNDNVGLWLIKKSHLYDQLLLILDKNGVIHE